MNDNLVTQYNEFIEQELLIQLFKYYETTSFTSYGRFHMVYRTQVMNGNEKYLTSLILYIIKHFEYYLLSDEKIIEMILSHFTNKLNF